MNTSTILLMFSILIICGFIVLGLWLYLKYKLIKKNVPQGMIDLMNEAERRFNQNVKDGKSITGEQVLFEIGLERRANHQNGTGEPSIEAPINSERRGEIQDGSPRVADGNQLQPGGNEEVIRRGNPALNRLLRR